VDTTLLVPALGLGFAYAAAPGVVNAECLRRGVHSGFRSGFLVQVGALVGDLLWAILALAGIAVIAEHNSAGVALSLAGGLFLCRMAMSALCEALRGPSAHTASAAGSIRTGLVFGLANPAGVAFWAGIGGGLLATRADTATSGDYARFLVAFLLGALCWSLAFTALASAGGRYARARLVRAVDATCGVLLGWFGIRLLWTGLKRIPGLPLCARLLAP
jgi:threonine/homoserine/homoserine lactone efflux protein